MFVARSDSLVAGKSAVDSIRFERALFRHEINKGCDVRATKREYS
jgi:hypothetical protein